MGLKITSWNVNGLRAVLNRNALDWVDLFSPEVLCLQEIKTRPDQLNDEQKNSGKTLFEDYYTYWNPAQRPGYSGVVTFSRQEPLAVQMGIGETRFDVEGRVIQTRLPEFLLFNIYFPNGQRDHSRVDFKLEFYAGLLGICDRLHAAGEKIVICGDFNTAHREIDLRNPKQNENTSGFLPEERAWIDRYLQHGLVDAYRVLYQDRVQYTWWTYRMQARRRNIGWRLDYFLVSEALLPSVQDVIIHEEILGSDHCPVSLLLNF